MIDWSGFPDHILTTLQNHTAVKSLRRQPLIYRDTSDFTQIDYGDVIHVDNRYFLVVGHTKEGRFGIDEQPKQWVPKVYDLESGERKILKLVFHETFNMKLGQFNVTCYRSPEKEGRVLELVHGNPMFMQGYSTLDEVGNLVRILDVIQGNRLDTTIGRIACDYERYLANHVEGILRRFQKSVEAIIHLHNHGLKHGDIRRDHIIVDGADGEYRWIDFDYDFYLPERPFALDLIGLGNILLFILGRRNFRPVDVLEDPELGEKVLATLHVDDLALLSRDRIFNLGKLYPSLPKCFNDILLHFSVGTPVIYDSVAEFADDLANCIDRVYG
ncbi:MAG TPA: hypothetical protein DDY32_02565 [Desulfobulbaceae bacterium]|nr:hypothetical protein [Desulfobulbaceae bacterium]